ncbi:hypothetical protein LY76DRAFT_390879 [Colletotrichum caudatum]|nr:hypothetical protein LY76DRAFT_390879 [Colletotrichum caudatum]
MRFSANVIFFGVLAPVATARRERKKTKKKKQKNKKTRAVAVKQRCLAPKEGEEREGWWWWWWCEWPRPRRRCVLDPEENHPRRPRGMSCLHLGSFLRKLNRWKGPPPPFPPRTFPHLALLLQVTRPSCCT